MQLTADTIPRDNQERPWGPGEVKVPGRSSGGGTWDAIVIGGGHNGLTAAAYLARAGQKVLVLEQRHVLGGACVSEEIYPGFVYSVCSYVVSLLRPWIVRDLELARHGLCILPLETSFTPGLDGRSLCRWVESARTRREIAAFSPRDAEIYPRFGQLMGRVSRFVKPIIDAEAPRLNSLHPRDLLDLAAHGQRLRDMDADLRTAFLKLMTASAADYLDEWFETDVLKAPMSVSGIIGTMLGVRSPGTAYVLLHHYMGEIDGAFRAWGFARGGTGAISEAIARSAVSSGAAIRTEAPVSEIIVEQGTARGVVLADGSELAARSVLSGCDPRRTFLQLVGEGHLPAQFTGDLKRFRYRGSSGKVNLAVDRLPDFACRPNAESGHHHLVGDVAIAPSIAYLERAFDEAKAGQFSRRPYINMVIPSLTDPTVAPPGKHVISCFVQYAPYHCEGGPETWPDKREAFGETVIDTLEEYMPGLRETILHKHFVTPWDLEQVVGLSEGNIFHGELTPDQLAFARPAPGWAHYRTPIQDLWLCGSGAHPGGGIMGGPGALAAKALLRGGRRP